MNGNVYNFSIPRMLNSAIRVALGLRSLRLFPVVILVLTIHLHATDWSSPEEQLVGKIANVTGPGAIYVTVENRSSLGRRDAEIVSNGLLAALQARGLRTVNADQSVATVAIRLSESPSAYVWVAEIHQGSGDPTVVMVSIPRTESATARHDSFPLTLRETPLWSQADRILDVMVMEEGAAPTHIAVLSPESISFYRMQSGKWQAEQSLTIPHAHPWPRDLRGRLLTGKDNLLEVYLPGVRCHLAPNSPLSLNCQQSDDPWPLIPATFSATRNSILSNDANRFAVGIPAVSGFYASSRNFFTGVLAPGIGGVSTAPKFYSAAPVAREKYVLWLFAAVDGQVHFLDGMSDQAARLNWGSDIASVRTSCGAGWQVLTDSDHVQSGDSLRAYELPDRDPVPVSAPLSFGGQITALWTEGKGDSAIAVFKSDGHYEASRISVSCNQ